MKTTIERFIFGLILAPLAPLAGFMVAWWAAYSWLPEKWIPLGALAGLSVGIAADAFLLRRWIERPRRLNFLFWAVIFLFYTVGMFGFFMGVPAFNVLLALPAGFVVAAKTADATSGSSLVRRSARGAAWFTTAVLFCVCAASAAIALLSPSTASDLQGMLGLHFEVTQAMILALIGLGGALLLAANWLLAWLSTRLAYWFFHSHRSAGLSLPL
jgi:hypothetical protein